MTAQEYRDRILRAESQADEQLARVQRAAEQKIHFAFERRSTRYRDLKPFFVAHMVAPIRTQLESDIKVQTEAIEAQYYRELDEC